ncbi:hypothetical protein NOV72_02012 [Caballeronia novacaledonica]|uniref:DNA 3'-5' helicase II n=2 Tax=Caballeronia novacaledonica TaxID=1544861 RepID=A0A2U3I3U9_9BURK|nr:hypothetical protein NOV72_02012 [Caballeronia novacaledonica]
MSNTRKLAFLREGSIIAPAGHGKTEEIAKAAAHGTRSLILTHTHAGVHAIKSRLKRMGVSQSATIVDTIAGWAMRYANAFPRTATPPNGMPRNAGEWTCLYDGAHRLLQISAIKRVVEASYDRVFIDEYQDCEAGQHQIAIALSKILPTVVLGDPMQGIFEFTGSIVSWNRDVLPVFPELMSLDRPWRWEKKNEDLGNWIAQVRQKLLRGERIDLWDAPVKFIESDDQFDMGAFFDDFDSRDGSVAAIHCWRQTCNQLAKASRGAYQSIEEVAAARLMAFAQQWDAAEDGAEQLTAIRQLRDECVHIKPSVEHQEGASSDAEVLARIKSLAEVVKKGDAPGAASAIINLSRKLSNWRVYRGELWRDAERTLEELARGRAGSAVAGATAVRQRVSLTGRSPHKRIISTPLLLKGLEFDHVVLPYATHFAQQRLAAAKLFYVAISRATRTLTVSGRERFLQFPVPTL